MLMVHGQKFKRVRGGVCEDWCPICRGPTSCKVINVRIVDHINYIPLDKGKPSHDTATCTMCGCVRWGKTGSFGRSVRDHSDYIAKLRQRESQAQSNKLDKAERLSVLAEPFFVVDQMLQFRFESGAGKSMTSLMQFFAIVVGIALFISWTVFRHANAFQQQRQLPIVLGIAVVFAISVSFAIWMMFRYRRHRALNHELPLAFRSVKALRPSLTELQEVRAILQQHDLKILKGVTEQDFRNLIELPNP